MKIKLSPATEAVKKVNLGSERRLLESKKPTVAQAMAAYVTTACYLSAFRADVEAQIEALEAERDGLRRPHEDYERRVAEREACEAYIEDLESRLERMLDAQQAQQQAEELAEGLRQQLAEEEAITKRQEGRIEHLERDRDQLYGKLDAMKPIAKERVFTGGYEEAEINIPPHFAKRMNQVEAELRRNRQDIQDSEADEPVQP